MPNNSSPTSLSLSFAYVAYKFSPNDDVIDVRRIEDVREVGNSTPIEPLLQCQHNFLCFKIIQDSIFVYLEHFFHSLSMDSPFSFTPHNAHV
jgi:hypothetical protein